MRKRRGERRWYTKRTAMVQPVAERLVHAEWGWLSFDCARQARQKFSCLHCQTLFKHSNLYPEYMSTFTASFSSFRDFSFRGRVGVTEDQRRRGIPATPPPACRPATDPTRRPHPTNRWPILTPDRRDSTSHTHTQTPRARAVHAHRSRHHLPLLLPPSSVRPSPSCSSPSALSCRMPAGSADDFPSPPSQQRRATNTQRRPSGEQHRKHNRHAKLNPVR